VLVAMLCTWFSAIGAENLAAQGVTTAAISGRVTNDQGQALPSAQVVVTNTATGAVSGVAARGDGRFFIPGLQPGTYRVAVSMTGFAPQIRENVTLSLGQTANFDFTLGVQAVELEGLTVRGERDGAVISRGRTGASSVVNDSTLRRSPTITRDLQDFTRLVPQLAVTNSSTGAVSAGGRNNRFNQLQIDGTASNDLFGLSASGAPGGQSGAKAITLEAIQELQVVIAPFDVRQNGFTGASVNAVTRSGTNQFKGSLSGFTRNETLAGRYKDNSGTLSPKLTEFQNQEYAGSFGGPILKDKAFFFLAGERTMRTDPTNYKAGTDAAAGITLEQATQVHDRLVELGFDPGSVGDRDIQRASTNLFGRLDFNLGENNRLTLRHNFVNGYRQNFPRSANTFTLGNGGYTQNNTSNSSVAQLNTSFGNGIFNELRLGYNRVRDHRDIGDQRFPFVRVEFGSRAVTGGSENSSQANELDQDAFELTNDLTIPFGAHSFTVGTSNEFAKFRNLFAQNINGYYQFGSFGDFLNGKVKQYDGRYPASGQTGMPSSEFTYRRYSLYAQDKWDARDNLQLTFGLRYELPTFPKSPQENPLVYQTYGRHTSEVPKANGLWNPRFGFNWDVMGDKATQVRGGVGLFSGRAPFVWISNAYGNTGLEYVTFSCKAANGAVPAFVTDPNNQPRNCSEGGTTTPAPNNINFVDPNLKLPQVARYSLAVDRQLPLGLVGTVEGLYTRNVWDLMYQNLRIEQTGATVEGRPQYRNRSTPGLGDAIDVTNTKEGSSYSLTGQIQRPFRNNWDFSVAYTYSHAEDKGPLGSSTAYSNWSFNLTDNDPNNPALARSDNDMPHRFVATTSYRANFLRRAATDISLVYVGQSGAPYSFRYNGDINGDGATGNDLVYVPRNESEIRFAPGTGANAGVTPAQSWQNLDAFISSNACLNDARGTVIGRNVCRAPWTNRFDFRIAQNVTAIRGQNAQITLDILNVGNMLNSKWGRSDFMSNVAYNLLKPTTKAADANGHREYDAFVAPKDLFTISNLDSRYQIQLGLRYSF
jgi:hypothetical protein